MLNYYVKAKEALKRLRADHDGVVSFEYIIVATCIIIVVIAVYNGTGANSISGALSTGVSKVVGAFGNLP
jgi:pilus assembly protein Flp/PilA